jgi:hypothetical protein
MTTHPLHPVGPDGYCVWLDWCTRAECKHPTTPDELIAAGGEWTWGSDL